MQLTRKIILASLTAALPSFPAVHLQAQTSTNWRTFTGSQPPLRDNANLTYDSVRNKAVLFGGGASISYYGDHWEWNGSSWSQVPPNGSWPPARTQHSFVFDSTHGKVIMFGGHAPLAFTTFSDTWEFNGSQWLQRNVIGPSARYGHAMAFDSQRAKVVLFGGLDGSATLGDTWLFDGQSWALASTSGPSARLQHSIAFDSTRGNTVLFGGSNGTCLGDTWTWSGSSWTQASTTGPSPREYPQLTFDNLTSSVVMFGGKTTGDLWRWNGNTWTQTDIGGPGNFLGGLTYDAARSRLLWFGGYLYENGNLSGYAGTYEYVMVSASANAMGSGCAGSAGTPTLAPLSNSLPRLGSNFGMAVGNLPQVATITVGFFGFNNQSFNGTPLPASMAPYGMPGCNIYTDVYASNFLLCLNGSGQWSVPIPNAAAMAGTHFYNQSFVFDSMAGNPAGIVATNALDALIGI